jgi:FAD/FMN-containing dehydrogenase
MLSWPGMASITRRRFVEHAAGAVAALCAHPMAALAGITQDPDARALNGASLDAAAIRRLASEISGHLITPDASDYESPRLIFNRAFDRHPALIVQCATASDVTRALEFAQNRNLPLAVRGGGHSDTAFILRSRGYELDIMGRWVDPADKPQAVRWVKGLRDTLQPLAHGTYVNQLGETSEELLRAAYRAHYARLVELKKKYDPKNVWRSNQNINPA